MGGGGGGRSTRLYQRYACRSEWGRFSMGVGVGTSTKGMRLGHSGGDSVWGGGGDGQAIMCAGI